MAANTADPDILFALAEMSYVLGNRADKAKAGSGCPCYYLCAGYAYHYLFTTGAALAPGYEPRIRLACDLYNAGLAECLRAARRQGRLDPCHDVKLSTPDGREHHVAPDTPRL